MWPYPWTHVGTPSHLGHMDRVAATMPSQAHAGAAQEAPDIGQWEGQDVPLVRPSSCNVKGGIPSSRRYLPTYLIVIPIFLLFRHVNPYYWTSQLVQLNVGSRLRLLAVACVLYLPTRSMVMENIGNNLIFKCKTRKMGFLYAPKHKHMTRT